ncbi:hypothetical protein FPV67DRAFT_1676298 [Lyophyllum atratum]|nr:hypothetical protein FPV67DRAFT_1679658 [Lyophyllum atratum]KAF8056500.1 hypothetical protein FPV67DRAFT_1677891 [Lyophyllum atratum]KAF8058730.1 hypothetical protein FPV67DRAFT_1676298 [Lyophyllum atratum]
MLHDHNYTYDFGETQVGGGYGLREKINPTWNASPIRMAADHRRDYLSAQKQTQADSGPSEVTFGQPDERDDAWGALDSVDDLYYAQPHRQSPSAVTAEPWANSDGEGSDGELLDNNASQEKHKADGPSPKGRPSSRDREVIAQTFVDVDALFLKASEVTGRTVTSLQKKYREHGREPSQASLWNRYQAYFSSNASEERERAGKPDGGARDCWPSFRDAPNHLEVLEFQEACDILEEEEPVRDRRRRFQALFTKMQRFAKSASAMRFESAILMVGSSVNSDTHLGQVWATAGLENFFLKRLGVSNEEVVGFAKTEAYDATANTATLGVIASRRNAAAMATPLAGSMTLTPSKSLSTPTTNSDGRKERATVEEERQQCKDLLLEMLAKAGHAMQMRGKLFQLPWSSLAKFLSDAGLCLHDWPLGVPFPGSGPKAKKGINGLATAPTRQLLAALRGETGRLPYLKKATNLMRVARSEDPVIFTMVPPAGSATRGLCYHVNGTITDAVCSPSTAAAIGGNGKHAKLHAPSIAVDSDEDHDRDGEDDDEDDPFLCSTVKSSSATRKLDVGNKAKSSQAGEQKGKAAAAKDKAEGKAGKGKVGKGKAVKGRAVNGKLGKGRAGKGKAAVVMKIKGKGKAVDLEEKVASEPGSETPSEGLIEAAGPSHSRPKPRPKGKTADLEAKGASETLPEGQIGAAGPSHSRPKPRPKGKTVDLEAKGASESGRETPPERQIGGAGPSVPTGPDSSQSVTSGWSTPSGPAAPARLSLPIPTVPAKRHASTTPAPSASGVSPAPLVPDTPLAHRPPPAKKPRLEVDAHTPGPGMIGMSDRPRVLLHQVGLASPGVDTSTAPQHSYNPPPVCSPSQPRKPSSSDMEVEACFPGRISQTNGRRDGPIYDDTPGNRYDGRSLEYRHSRLVPHSRHRRPYGPQQNERWPGYEGLAPYYNDSPAPLPPYGPQRHERWPGYEGHAPFYDNAPPPLPREDHESRYRQANRIESVYYRTPGPHDFSGAGPSSAWARNRVAESYLI